MQLRRAKERSIRLQQSDIREVTSGMNPAQKRRWNAYSTRKKQKLFGQARRAAKKKRRYQRAALDLQNENYTEQLEPLRIWQEELPEHLDAPVRQETALEEQRWGRERSEYRTAAFKKSTPEENDRGSSQKRVETQSATTCWQSQVGVQATTVSWQSREGLRQKAPETDSRPPNRIEKRRDRKSESTIRELLGLVDRDIRRTEGIKQDIRSEQIQMSEAEYETAKTVAATSLIPLRLRYERTRRDVRSAMQRAGFSLARYLVPLSGLFFLVVLLYAILMGLIGGLAGSEAEESTYGASNGASGYEIVDYAREWIGVTRYVWGAGRSSATDWQDYADCSSFAHGVFAHLGYEIGWTTYEQEHAGTLVSGGLSNAQPGDLILFYSGSISAGNSSHVGIYAGDGQMIHCSGGRANTFSNPGRGVCMGSVAADGRRYVIRRVAMAVHTDEAGPEELLALLEKYNTRLEADKEKGVKWWYTNKGTPSTWAAATSINAKKATNCAQLIRWALKELGVIEKNDFFYFTYNNTFKWGGSTESHLKAHAEIIPVHKRARSLIASGYLKPGDICCWHSLQHINVYAGKNKWFDAGRGGTNGHWENFGHEDQDGWEMRTYVFDKWGPVKTTYLDTQVDYIIRLPARTVSENGTGGGYRADPTAYTKAQMELIWAIVAQEDNGSYAGALAVISSAMNRTESVRWKSLGSTALAQLTAPGQYCYSNDSYWRRWLGGNVPGYVKQAVWDCLKKGIRNHKYTSFRSRKGSQTGASAVQIGGNWYFGF